MIGTPRLMTVFRPLIVKLLYHHLLDFLISSAICDSMQGSESL